MRLSQLAILLNGNFSGEDVEVTAVSTPEEQKTDSVCILSSAKYAGMADGIAAAYVIPKEFPEIAKPHIVVDNTRLALVGLINALLPEKTKKSETSPRASVSFTADVSHTSWIGDFAVVGDNSKIGENCKIYHGVVIGENVTIGENTTIYPNAVIYDNCVIGRNVIIHAGAAIGGDGFGFVPAQEHVKIPHRGNVVLEDNVEIGSNSTIDRGTLGSTIIGSGTKVDNLVHIAHNVITGRGCFIAGQSGISGSTKLGDYVILGGQVGAADHIEIASFASFAAKSGISGNITEGVPHGGIPAVPAKQWAKQVASISKLPEMRKRFVQIEKLIMEEKGEK